ncbi:MAG TPA: TRAP transporter small permease subunit [Desulfobacteria bacterium]|nr:TRAP transporter small permease subunit [Desulfobacteria bacterium]
MGTILKFLRIMDSVSDWSGRVVCYLILFLALIVGYEVVVRYAFDSPTVWVNELSTMFFGTFVILGGAYTALREGHVNMDVIYGTLRPRTRALLDVITMFLAFIFVGVLVWNGWEAALRSLKYMEHASTQWGPPLYPFRIMLPLGALLLFLQLIAKFIRDLMTLFTGKEPKQWKSEA